MTTPEINPRGRFAPSLTGDMHVGNARTALVAWLSVRAAGGTMVLRIEDLDSARVVPAAERGLCDDLRRLGLDWDEGPDRGGAFAPYRQSERRSAYDRAVSMLLKSERAFLCACTRADVARAASAPHADEEGPRYPGTCKQRPADEIEARARALGRHPVVRFDGRGERIAFDDEIAGAVPATPGGVDDFVLRRADGTAAYQLAVVVDDIGMEITKVVRGDDLLTSTPRQIALARALGGTPPQTAHVPLVLGPAGERLAKRARPVTVRSLLDRGVTPERIVGELAATLGLCAPGQTLKPQELVAGFSFARLRRGPVEIDAAMWR